MTIAICPKCRGQYNNKSEPDSIFCHICQMRSNVRIYEYISETFWALWLFCSLWFIPLAILPLVFGANSSGYYRLFRKDVTPFTFLMMNLVNFGLMIAFSIVWRYFKRKFNTMKISLSKIEKDTPNFGRRWKE